MKYKHITVLGGGFAGSLAALIASRHAERVTIIEPSPWTEEKGNAGIPQSEHVHILVKRGQDILEILEPRILERLKAAGALLVDWAQETEWKSIRGTAPQYDSNIKSLVFSRKLVNRVLHQEIAEKPSIQIVPCRVKKLIFNDSGIERIVLDRQHALEKADLYIDTRGRTANTLDDLADFCGIIPEKVISNKLSYTSTVVAGKPQKELKQYFLQASSGQPLGYYTSPIEGDRYIFTVADLTGKTKSVMRQFARHPVLRHKEVKRVHSFRKLHNKHRMYGKAKRFPNNLAILGDAVCQLNPTYGHGLSLCVDQVHLLHDTLQNQDFCSQSFQRLVDKSVWDCWHLVKTEEWRIKPNTPLHYRFIHRYLDLLHEEAMHCETLHKLTLRVVHRLASPTALFSPRTVLRMVASKCVRFFKNEGRRRITSLEKPIDSSISLDKSIAKFSS